MLKSPVMIIFSSMAVGLIGLALIMETYWVGLAIQST